MQTNSHSDPGTDSLRLSNSITKMGAGLADAAIFLFLYNQLAISMPQEFITFGSNLSLPVLLILYRGIATFLLEGTLGMFICNCVYLNGDKEFLKPHEKLLAACFLLINDTRYYDK